jgi:pyruvate,orthophosphate dikinase
LSRAKAVARVAPLLADPPTTALRRTGGETPFVKGLPASPGIVSGEIATSPEAAVAAAEAGHAAILVRAETSPEDVHGMARAAGILTSRGGLASHAAVVARGWGIPAVVGAADLEVRDGEIVVGERILHAGDVITIDGGTGEGFEGAVAGATVVVPEAKTLLAWAAELGIPIGSGDDPASAQETLALECQVPVTPDACLRAIGIKGFAQLQGVADVVLAKPEDIQRVLDALVADGLVAPSAGALRLTKSGTSRAAALLAEEQATWGLGNAEAALDAFIELDQQLKQIVTAWQLRDAAAGVVNDHLDLDHDRAVLDRLATLQAHAVAWLTPLEAGCPRLAGYRVRLGRAVEAATAGDGRYVASPRVDSYHGVWFELHEDLIQLAGRTREAEVAAGRA